MAEKTVLKNTLSKWGILSTTMQMAIKTDQAMVKGIDGADPDVDYVDAADQEEAEPRPPEEVIKPAANAKPMAPEQAQKAEEIWSTLIEFAGCDDLPAQAKKEIQAAADAKQNDPIILGQLLAKVKASYEGGRK
jgi:hypothetical protein